MWKLFLSKSRKFFDILLQNDLIETNQFCHQMELKVNKPWLVLIEKKKSKLLSHPLLSTVRQKLCHSNGVSKFCKQKNSIKFRKVLFIAPTRGMELAFCGWRIWSWGFTFKWKVLCSNLRLISTFHWLNIRSTSLVCRYRNLKQMLKSCGDTFR